MHVWFLHKRLISDVFDKDRALMIQEELFNILCKYGICNVPPVCILYAGVYPPRSSLASFFVILHVRVQGKILLAASEKLVLVN